MGCPMSKNSLSNVFQPFITKKGGINKGCKYIAKKLKNEWAWKYLYHVYRGTVKPSDKLIRKLKALRPPSPPRKRHRMIIEAASKEQWEGWQVLTMDQKRNALDTETEQSQFIGGLSEVN